MLRIKKNTQTNKQKKKNRKKKKRMHPNYPVALTKTSKMGLSFIFYY